jgi:hypothetical protein
MAAVDWYRLIFEAIDMRSFSNLWYWIALAVVWSTASHWVLGVPYDMIQRARRRGGQAETDLEDILRVNVNRLLYIGRASGLWLLGFGMAVHTSLVLLGFWYRVEFAQALFLIAFPMSFVGLLSMATASWLEDHWPRGDALYRKLFRHRLYTQIIGMISIFVTAMWGMAQNIATGPLGH